MALGQWAHVLIWDLFAGRWLFLDGREKGIPVKHSLLLTFSLGPVGILTHCEHHPSSSGWPLALWTDSSPFISPPPRGIPDATVQVCERFFPPSSSSSAE